MWRFLLLPASAIMAACMGRGAGPPPAESPRPDEAVQVPDTERYLFSDSLHDIRFVVSRRPGAHGADCRVEAVDLYPKGRPERRQHLVLADMAVPCPMPDGQFPAVELLDLDFDGRPDLRIMRAAADLSHPTHRYWLFDPAQGGFVPCPALDSIQDPQFDRERQLVSSQWYARPGLRGGSTFRYVNGRPTLVSNMEKYTEGDHERWVIWGMKEGRLQPVEERIKPLPGH